MSALSNLAEIDAYLADRADVIDGDYGQPAPNVEMNLQRELEEAVGMIRELIKADHALDAASRSLNETDPATEDAETMEAMRLHRQRCISRRAAALARIGRAE